MSSLSGRKVATSFAWSSIENGGAQLAQVLVFFIVARLLSPEDIGQASLALILTQAFQIIIGIGIEAYVVSLREEDRALGDSCAFWFSVAIGLAQFAAVLIVGGVMTALAFETTYIPLYAVAALTNLVTALGLAQQAWLRRALMMKSLAIRTLTAAAVGGATSIALALLQFGAYAIMLQTLIQSGIGTVLLWRSSPWRPERRISLAGLRHMLAFSRHVFATGLLSFITNNADIALIGAILGAHATGVYAVARRALAALNGIITTALSQVSLPVFARIRDEGGDLEGGFLSVIALTSLVTVPLFLGLSAFSSPIITLLFGTRWAEAIPIMALLMPIGALQSLGVYNQSYAFAAGRPDLQTRLALLYATITIPLIAITAHISLVAVAIAFTLRVYVTFPLSMATVTGISRITHRQYLLAVAPAFACGALVYLTALAAQLHSGQSPLFQFAAATLAGGIAYGASLLILARKMITPLVQLVAHRRL